MSGSQLLFFERLFFVGIGAIPGALLRWLLHNDFIVNIFGSGLLGLFMGLKLRWKYKLIFCIGFCGSFTTFSGWIMKINQLFGTGLIFKGISLIAITIGSGLLTLFAGFLIGAKIKESIMP